ncbi:MarR family transcriptional regulator [Mycolicibacterium sp. 050232]|uniref:MarR family winged helix-turn-helix transcriptional regulator n=1 Tax=Mycolicibacterium sp. 050232 TaxID=3113982 RepID=UPI002E2B1EF1|nr:MarR family transcriptional regulator [Mycolicibacterium sp. 050232]MED5815120.1 MarR family transcriptional regulator [Mycolicibacterium sp. 050232]
MQRRPPRRTAGDLPGLDLAEQKSWQSYLDAAIRFDAAMNRRLTDQHRLPVVDLRVLDALSKSADGEAQMGDLAAMVDSRRDRLSKRIHRLEERGLVSRRTRPEDRRKIMAVITEAGLELVRLATDTYAEGVRHDFLGSLSRAQVSAIEENCRRINDGLMASEPSP